MQRGAGNGPMGPPLLGAGGLTCAPIGAIIMNIASLALASTVAIAIGCAQPAFAQSQDQTGPNQDQTGAAAGQNHSGTNGDEMMNGGAMQNPAQNDDEDATTGQNAGDRSGNGRDDEEDNAAAQGGGAGNWQGGGRWGGRRAMGMRMGAMAHQRMMMRAFGGAQFHFARGNARMDVRCSAEEDTQACVRAATELLDKLAQLRNKGQDNTTGSATGEENDQSNNPGASPAPPQNHQNQPNQNTPGVPGQRM